MKPEIKTLSNDQIKEQGISSWPIWEKEISKFDWEYDSTEHCLILEGEVTVECESGAYSIKKGDFVTFPKGMKCNWDIKSPIKKYYAFE